MGAVNTFFARRLSGSSAASLAASLGLLELHTSPSSLAFTIELNKLRIPIKQLDLEINFEDLVSSASKLNLSLSEKPKSKSITNADSRLDCKREVVPAD
ncbi:hypothetical protein DPEC_G00253410 [Dallia pectoralis]|uniref:Uncharacterized protein n=1 Tax=Dallia pectoralis TaxID=75939 RepID=A0ACC2FU24_DALPE|nr:hypothetical protein DPEC_G00253410 [Dallia pectoralis]